MRFLQEMIAKKKHARDAQGFSEAPADADDLSAQDMHANAFGAERAGGEPTILPYRVPVDGDEEDTGSALDAFREQASASLDAAEPAQAESAEIEGGYDTFDEDETDGSDALDYDSAMGARHADEEEGRDDLEYVDHFAASEQDPLDRAFAEPHKSASAPSEEPLDPALRSFFTEESPVAEEPVDDPEPMIDPVVAPAAQPMAAPEPQMQAAMEPAPMVEPTPVGQPEPMVTPEPAPEDDPMLRRLAEDAVAEAPEAPQAPAPMPEAQDTEAYHSMFLKGEDETPPDASMFFDKPAEDRLMERTNEILANSAQAEVPQAAAPVGPKKIWDLGPQPAAAPAAPAEPAEPQQARRRAGRVKTRLLGFNRAEDAAPDPFENAPAAQIAHTMFPVGWIMVIKGPGRGSCFTLFSGASKIGRGEGQAIRLDFGDTSISRDNHAAVAYDEEQRQFYLGHGGKANLVRLNDMPVLSTEPLTDGDLIRIGETTLQFVAFCSEEFAWADTEETEGGDAS
ncbi:MAG: FHA domain-containing protein [Pseudomonadota bacterium]